MRCWLLLDAALLDERALRNVTAVIAMSSALSGSPLVAYGSRAPRVALLPSDPDRAADIAKRLIALDPRAPAVSVLRSASTEDELIGLFAYLAQATVDGDLPVHCRFADSRVLPGLLPRLSPSQQARLTRAVSRWTWIDHLGQSASWQPPVAAEAVDADAEPHLKLSMSQVDAILAESEPDTIFALLLDTTPELVPDDRRGAFRDRLSRILVSAATLSVELPNDRLQYVILALGFGETFHQEPELQSTWQALARKQTTLQAAMQTWDDAFWDRLEARRAAR